MSWTRFFRRRYWDDERARELDAYLEAETDENMARGMPPEEARYAAHRKLGNTTRIREEIYRMNSLGWLETLWQDVRFALRMLRKNPGFTAVAVLTLALGIGANTVMFSVVNGVLLRPLSYPDAGRLMDIVSVGEKDHGLMLSVSPADFPYIKGQADVFDGLALYGYSIPTLTGQGEPEQFAGGAATSELFSVLRVKPLMGRVFLPDEVAPGRNRVVILSHRLWQRRFGGDRAIIGKSIDLNDQPHTVVGVMPPGFAFPSANTELWLPLVLNGQEAVSHRWRSRRMLARLKPGADLKRAQLELDTIGARLARQFPVEQAWGLKIIPMKELMVGGFRHGLLLLLGAVAFVLLTACANLASLFLSRSRTREREMAIRCSLGATHLRVIRQLLTESLIVAAIGGGMGLLLVPSGIEFIRATAPADIPRLDQINVDGWVLWFVFGASMLTGLLVGLAPALQISEPDMNAALKEGLQADPAGSGLLQAHRTRSVLVVAEIALAMVLMSGAVLLLRSLWKRVNVNPGFDPQNLLTMELSVTSRKYHDDKAQIPYLNELVESVASLPGVKSAALASSSPLYMSMSVDFNLSGGPSREQLPQAGFEIVSPDYFRTLGTHLLEGRPFTWRDNENSTPVVVVNRCFAQRYLAGYDPLGKKIHIGWGKDQGGTDAQIAGVVSDLTPEDRPWPAMYVSYLQFGTTGFTNLLVRTATNPLTFANAVRRRIWSVNSEQPVANVRTVAQDMSTTVSEPRFRTLLLGAFAGLALALALIGVYGAVSYTVIRRTHEIGIRIALGASRWDILRRVLKQGLVFAGFGLTIGLGLSLVLTQLLRSFLFEVQPNDPMTLSIALVVVGGTALLAAYLPARRATKVDPMVALRYE